MRGLTLQIFISSPGDVGQERLLAIRVLERLQGEFGGLVTLKSILWEHEPLEATAHFQEQIPPPSQADVVVCILWSRLGTRLPEQYCRPDGSRYASGTEWEFEDAERSFRERGRPALLVYRKTAERFISSSDPKYDEVGKQRKALDAFLKRWFENPDDSLRRAFHPFPSADRFEELLETHLRRLIRGRLPKHLTERDEVSGPVTWPTDKGSPYRGLRSFDVEHAPVFFGRTRAIEEIKDRLIHQSGIASSSLAQGDAGQVASPEGQGSGPAFLVVFGMSGCGKSSLVRAGVVPTLTQPGIVEGIGLWRWSTFRPIGSAGDLCDGLARALLGPQALPELEAVGLNVGELAALFREAPQRAVAPLRMGLKAAAEAKAAREADGPLPGRERPPEARLLLVVDQMEELFTREGVDTRQREGFVAVLSALARSGQVWVLATMRSDYFPRCAEIPALAELQEGLGQYSLRPPSVNELRQMIAQPARAAGLRFEIEEKTRDRLEDKLHDAAARDPEVLPLLEFTLDELFKQRTQEGILTFEAYERLGGLEGALTRRAEETLTALPPPVQEALPSLLRTLVTVAHDEGASEAGRRVPLASLTSSAPTAALAEALIQARLLVTDRADDGQAVVGVAHEALLRRWPRVQKWLTDNQEFLRVRDRVADAAARWRDEEKRTDFLLPVGKPLAEAEDLLARQRADLDTGLVEFIEASRRHAAHGRRRKRQLLAAAMASLLAFGVISSWQWHSLQRQQDQTVETIANLIDVPQKLKGMNDRDSVKVLDEIYKANQSTLDKAPNTPGVRRAKAVNCRVRAEMLLRSRDYPAALDCFEEALKEGQKLALDRRDPRDQVRDQRNLGVFYSTQGDILERLDRYDDALKAYQEGRRWSQRAAARGDAEALRDQWYSHFLSADLQLRQLHLDDALRECRDGLQLADDWARRYRDPRAPSDLAQTYLLLREILLAQSRFYEDQGDTTAARRYRSEAQAAEAKSLSYKARRASPATTAPGARA
jgi:tetratricopeptide (TPR) repeat protein